MLVQRFSTIVEFGWQLGNLVHSKNIAEPGHFRTANTCQIIMDLCSPGSVTFVVSYGPFVLKALKERRS